jgi:AraC family transcriptional activator of pobA
MIVSILHPNGNYPASPATGQLETTSVLFEIRTLEYFYQCRPEQLNTYCRSTNFEIIWIKNEAGACQVDLEKEDEGGNSIVHCIGMGQLRRLHATKDIKGCYISFSPEFINLPGEKEWPFWIPNGCIGKGRKVWITADDVLSQQMDGITEKMTAEFESYFLLKGDVIRGLLRLMILYLSRHVKPDFQPVIPIGEDRLVRTYLTLLENNVKKKRKVFDYAQQLGITANYLNARVKRATGFSAKYHMDQLTVLEAKRQFINKHRTMKEIAYDLGFDDISHFSKFFKTNSGSSFYEFKKCLQQAGNNLS